jgi:CRISPR system Cascade subunit CasE
MHRTLSRAFPPNTFNTTRGNADTAGALFRVDEQPRTNSIVVLVQSQVAPDWTYLNDKRDARGHTYLLQPAECKSFDLKLVAGQTLTFRLRANPTKRLGRGNAKQPNKRIGLHDEHEQIEWLQRKAEAGGFRIVRAMLSRDDYIENEKAIHRDDQSHDLKMLSVQFDGVLQIVNADQFVNTIAHGIGSGKGFGFGLLSLAPA